MDIEFKPLRQSGHGQCTLYVHHIVSSYFKEALLCCVSVVE